MAKIVESPVLCLLPNNFRLSIYTAKPFSRFFWLILKIQKNFNSYTWGHNSLAVRVQQIDISMFPTTYFIKVNRNASIPN